ncbi:Hint domain-containing protein [Thalassococcus lentus]|uniref:Hint domain-containing protein n=1 Tax=Thalassococcus lentus TaxID=1210524 RepID=A0ABT4XS32_9RHOB|nr:Hint domain-containing protein [Thalassococcus lentus]MDA7424735.1 Hint domain-containing protein [Thalassococcus lentus]
MEFQQISRADGARRVNETTAQNALAAGTVVLTLDGALPVEFINEGDRVITRDSGMAVVRKVRRTTQRSKAIAIKAGSLGNNRPDRDAVLPANQEILVRDWRAEALFGASQALVSASRLVDGEFVRDLGTREIDMIELIFDTPHILYADGLEVASATAETASSDTQDAIAA